MSSEPENAKLLSTSAREALAVDPMQAYAQLVVNQPGNAQAKGSLQGLTPTNVLLHPAKSTEAAACVLSGLWLWHDWLDQSHRLSQDIHTPDGSYWHAIMHRREGDFWNSKYWLNKCRGHPALPLIGNRITGVINASPAANSLVRMTLGDFDPHSFVDLVEELHGREGDPRRGVAVQIQRIEWQTLLEHCLRAAAG